MLQTDFLSYTATNMDKASIRSRSHGEDVSKLVDQNSDADVNEERRKSETDLAASQGLPAVKSTINTNDLRYVEREVTHHVSPVGTADKVPAVIIIQADPTADMSSIACEPSGHQLDWTSMMGSQSLCRLRRVQSRACQARPSWVMASGTTQPSRRAAGALHG